MAEIKSTLELALERTRKMSISEEEKREIKRKEIVQKATSEYEREEQEAEEKGRVEMEEALRKVGIHGSAVVPHVKESKEWRERIGTVKQGFRGKIEEVKEALRKR